MPIEDSLVKSYSNEGLRKAIERRKHALESAEKSVENLKADLRQLEAESIRRDFSLYWDKHPDLTPVNLGDWVMVTPEIVAKYGGGEKAVGTTMTVKKLSIDDMQNVQVDLGAFVWPAIEEVCSMRKAYLDAHPIHA